ncbi:MAG TPA: efflux RND transporter permease subunit [Vicinamibacterales bacterium]|nr:efflux RND transporter permease subunit [Vicinamibacterales bacterium]
MWISDTSIKRPVFATMVIVSFMVLGIVSLGRLGIDLFPEVNFPFVNISIVYPGAGPEEVETLVTRPIEDAVAGINGVKRVISTSTEGFSRVGIELRLEIDPQAATAEVREKVAAIRERLPEQIKDPTIQRFDVSALPIATYAVGSSSLPSDRIRRMVEDDLKPLLGQIDGVAAVEVNGGQVRELQVNLDPRRLEALNLPITEVAAKLAADNLDVPGGQVRRDGKAVSLRTQGQYKAASEIENVILRSEGGSTVRVKDVGEVVDGYEDRSSTTRLDGADAVSFSVRKQSGANTVDVQHKIDAALAKAAPSFPELQIKTVHTDAEGIIENVEDVRMNIIFGGIMAVLVVFVFMRDWRSTAITALALPTSVIATFFFMYAVGFTINMMTLMALSLVIGILIDDAVVVRESIYRHMEHGEDPVTAARNGTSEIGLAVMATTFTILAVFLPVGFMTGIVGQFFKSFALTIAFAVSISLLVAFTLDPMLSSRFVRFIPLEERTRTRTGRFMERVGHFYDRIDVQYHKLLGWAVDNPWKIVATAAIVFFASLSTLSVIGTEFVPAEDRGEFVVNIEAPPGTAFEQTVAHVVDVEKIVRQMPEVKQIFSTVGFEGSPLKASLRVKASKKYQRERTLEQMKADMRSRLKQIPLLKMTVADPEFMQGSPTQAPLSVYLRGDDMAELQRLNEEVVAKVKAVPGAVDVDSTLETGQPEMAASVNREIAADLGFDVGSVAMQLRGMVEGIVPTRLREADKEYDIRVRLAPEFRNDFESIARTPLYSPTGSVVRARDIVKMNPEVGPAAIEREQRRRQAKINIELSDRALGDVTADVGKVMAGIAMPANFEWGFAGDVEMMQEAGASMALALILAMAFIYIVLASQFESFLEPFLIMTSLPLALVGALLALLLTGRNIGMPAMIGVVMLMGLVTKNAILLVDLTNQYVRDGLSVKDAILKAGPVRLRPIMMTTIAMILGMMPSAVGTGEGSGFRSPISIATIGGLITSTLLTLVVVPVSYLLLARFIERMRAFRSASVRVPQAVRVAGVVLLVALVGWLLSTSTAFASDSAREQTSELRRDLAVAASGREGGQPSAGQATGTVTLTFEQALQRALSSNEGLKVAKERVVETQARVQEAKTSFLPQVNLGYNFTPAQRFPVIKIPAGIFGPEEQTFQAGFAQKNSVQLFVNQPIYTGGRLNNAYGITSSSLDASELELERTRQEIEYRVVETYYAALMNQRGVAVSEEQIALSEKQLALAKARFESGTVARLDVLQAEVELANAKARRIQQKAQVDTSMQALRTVLALPQTQAVRLDGSLDEPVVGHAREELDRELPKRPDLQAFASRRQSAEYASNLADSEWKPSLSFAGNMQYQQDSIGSLLGRDNQSYAFGIQLQVPLFAAPGAAARRGIAQSQMRQAEHGLRYATDNARLELESAWTALEASAEVVTTQEKALEMARESVSIAQVSYENGVITSAELNDAQVRLLQTEWLLMQAKYARITAAARAKVAAGVS